MNILYWLIEGKTQLGMPRGAKMSLALNERNRLLFESSFKFKHYHQACTTSKKKF